MTRLDLHTRIREACGSGGIFGSVGEVVEQKNFICNQDLNLRIKLGQILRFTNLPFFSRVHE